MWVVYVLLCADGSLYTGSTNNLTKRYADHQTGSGAKYTRAKKVLRVVYTEEFETKSAALRRESEIKSWRRMRKIVQLRLTGDKIKA